MRITITPLGLHTQLHQGPGALPQGLHVQLHQVSYIGGVPGLLEAVEFHFNNGNYTPLPIINIDRFTQETEPRQDAVVLTLGVAVGVLILVVFWSLKSKRRSFKAQLPTYLKTVSSISRIRSFLERRIQIRIPYKSKDPDSGSYGRK